MKIYQPHHSKLIIKLEYKKYREDFYKKLKDEQDEEIGIFLGNRFNHLFDNKYYVNILMEKIIIKDNSYILSLSETDCQNFTFMESPFEPNPTDIDLETPGNLWNYIVSVFSKGQKYNSSISINAFKDTVAYDGIKVENITFSGDDNNIFNLCFTKLDKLPVQFKGKELQESEYVFEGNDFFEEPSVEENIRNCIEETFYNLIYETLMNRISKR